MARAIGGCQDSRGSKVPFTQARSNLAARRPLRNLVKPISIYRARWAPSFNEEASRFFDPDHLFFSSFFFCFFCPLARCSLSLSLSLSLPFFPSPSLPLSRKVPQIRTRIASLTGRRVGATRRSRGRSSGNKNPRGERDIGGGASVEWQARAANR